MQIQAHMLAVVASLEDIELQLVSAMPEEGILAGVEPVFIEESGAAYMRGLIPRLEGS